MEKKFPEYKDDHRAKGVDVEEFGRCEKSFYYSQHHQSSLMPNLTAGKFYAEEEWVRYQD